jgi:hypothetical protein
MLGPCDWLPYLINYVVTPAILLQADDDEMGSWNDTNNGDSRISEEQHKRIAASSLCGTKKIVR